MKTFSHPHRRQLTILAMTGVGHACRRPRLCKISPAK